MKHGIPFRNAFHRHAGTGRRVRSDKKKLFTIEQMEPRLLLDASPIPIDPSAGEANLLQLIDSIPLQDIQNALDQFPIPFVVIAQKDGLAPVITNGRAGAPTRVDVDDSLSTGKGGNDLSIEVNTELLPTPHLTMSLTRLGTSNFVNDITVLVAFPFDAFTNEALPGAANLFFGYQTTANDGSAGGIAPLTEVITLTTGVLAGTNHLVTVGLNTTGDTNPLRFFAGHFDGDVNTGLLNYDALAAWIQDVPDNVTIGLNVGENALFSPKMLTSFGLTWDASSRSLVEFNYLENEHALTGSFDYATTVIVDKMPTHEQLSLSLDEDAGTLTLHHRADSVIDKLQVRKLREDGLLIRGTATDVPTEVDLSFDLSGSLTLNVNANTLDFQLEALKEGGFLDTSDVLGYDLGYASLRISNAPDLTAAWDGDTMSFNVQATNAGESIGSVEIALDDDAHYGAIIDGLVDVNNDGVVNSADDGQVAIRNVINGFVDVNSDGVINGDDDGNVAGMSVINGKFDVNHDGVISTLDDIVEFLVGFGTPPSYYEGLPGFAGELHHIFALVDDGTHGTAIARIVQVKKASLDLDDDASEVFHLELAAPAVPMQAYLRTFPTSNIIPGHDIEITCDIDDVPFGVFDIHFDGPGNFGYTTNPPQGIDLIHCFGHIDFLNFDIEVGDLPPVFDFEFDPDSHITVFAQDGFGGPDEVGHIAARFWDKDGPTGLDGTAGLLGQNLRDARMRVDHIPSSHAKWTQVQNLSYDGGSGVLAAVGNILYDSATGATAEVLSTTGAVAASGTIKIGFIETGAFNDNNSLDVLDSLDVDGQKEDFALGALVTGAVSGATATVRRVKQIGGTGTLYLSGISGTFQNDEDLKVDNKVIAKVNGTLHVAPTWAALVNGALTDAGTTMDFDTDATDVFLGGVQFEVSTSVEFEDPLPAASLSAPDFAFLEEETVDSVFVQRMGGGAFGIDAFHFDTFSSLNLHYDANETHLLVVDILRDFDGSFFPASANFRYDLQLAVNKVPQQWDFTSDLSTQYRYTGSGGIAGITLSGTVDETNDSANNGYEVSFAMIGLPSDVRFGIITDELAVVNGRLDVNKSGTVTNDDDGKVAGGSFIDGRFDVNGDGVITGSDDGVFFGIPVINGELDIDESGTVDGGDDGAVAGADLKMNAGINEVGFQLRSIDEAFGIHGSDFRLISVLADDVPAEFVLSYGGGRFLMETNDASGNPDPLEQINALISTSKNPTTNDAKVLPFTLDGPIETGPILSDAGITGGNPGGSRIHYSPFLQEIDERYYNDGVTAPSGVLGRLAELYADSEQLDTGEDHLLIRKENLDGSGGDEAIGFVSFEFNRFQRLSWIPDANGGQFQFRAPTRGNEGFFAGYEEDDVFNTLQIEHIPDEITVDFDKTEHLIYTANVSPGEIDFYRGPGNGTVGLFAQDSDSATRAIMRNTPSSVRVLWSFGFPNGGAIVDASNEFDLLFLTQDGSKRIAAGLTLEDLHLGYGIDILSFDVTKSIEIWNPFGDNIVIPIAWELFQAKAGIDNDADGLQASDLGDTDEIAGNPFKPDVAGFFALYDMVHDPSAISGGTPPAPGSDEYVPLVTVMTEGFREFSLEFLVELDPTNFDADIYPIDLELNGTLTGNLVLDIWSSANTHFTDNDDIPFIPEVGFVNPPDYTDNTPFHILPGIVPGDLTATIVNGLKGIHVVHDWVITWDGFHTFNEHFDPFAGSPPPFTGSSGDGGFNGGDAQFVITTLGPFNGALSRWQAALAASGTYTDDEAADLINDIASNTEIQVGHFAGAKIGAASGNSGGATIQIDPDAGGFSWFIDSTPFDDSEYDGGGPPPADLTASGGTASGKVDMLTFFEHEIGHILGFGHADAGVMLSTLPRSVRRIPVADDVDPGAPPNPAPAGDDNAALMVDMGRSPSYLDYGVELSVSRGSMINWEPAASANDYNSGAKKRIYEAGFPDFAYEGSKGSADSNGWLVEV